MRRLLAFIILVGTVGMIAACSKGDSNKVKNLTILGMLAACGENVSPSSGNQTGNNVYLSPNTPWSIYPGQTLTITATVSNDSNIQGVTWAITGAGAGTLSNQTLTSVTYTAPSNQSSNAVNTIMATSNAFPAYNASLQITIIPDTGSNIQPIAVDGGPVAGQIYPDAAFTSVTICSPGSTSNCQTVNGILVDTGSYGLRILASQVSTLGLTPEKIGGHNINNCAQFADGSFLWGPVAKADVYMADGKSVLSANEKASSVPIQLIQDPTGGYSIPSSCSQGGIDDDNQADLGANGILGVGTEPQDCAILGSNPCVTSTDPGIYYQDRGTGFLLTTVPIAQQVTNPVYALTSDSNGVIIELPSVSGATASVQGSMIFGIGTQSNNSLGSADVFPLLNSNFTTDFNGQALNYSFIDSGSNGFFFDASIPYCSDDPSLYCPSTLCGPTTMNFSAINEGTSQSTVNFSVDNADILFQNYGSYAAFSNLAGPFFSGSFDWGLPFFFGRIVFTAIDGMSTPIGNGPYVAY